MTEIEFFLKLFPQTYKTLNKDSFINFDEGPVCECVGENTNKALTLYFQSIINQGIELPIFINTKNHIMDGHHRIQAYHLLGRNEIPIYSNKLWRFDGKCWKKGRIGKKRLRLKPW